MRDSPDACEKFAADVVAAIPELRRYARKLLIDRSYAEDLVQDCIECACRSAASFDPSRGVRPWLFRILYNLFVNKVRKDARQRRTVSLYRLEQEARLPVPSPEQTLHMRQTLEALRSLPPVLRDTLSLYAFDELSCEEIAHTLEVPLGTVLSRLHRARRRLRRNGGAPGEAAQAGIGLHV